MWKKFKLVCKKQLHGLKNQGKGYNSGKKRMLKMKNNIGSWELPSKQGL
jgi:hypothetical protein